MIKLLDIVILMVDLPEMNLCSGRVGTVVEILKNGEAFEVEFWSSQDDVVSLGLTSDQIAKMFS